MKIKIINVLLSDDGTMQSELDKFLSMNRVLDVEQHFFVNGNVSGWSFCIKYIVSNQSSFTNGKIDYKKVLSEEQFEIFIKLREIRKHIAAKEATQAYIVFTDEELANIARLPEIELGKLITIKGIGEKKLSKYGKPLLAVYNEMVKNPDSFNSLDIDNILYRNI